MAQEVVFMGAGVCPETDAHQRRRLPCSLAESGLQFRRTSQVGAMKHWFMLIVCLMTIGGSLGCSSRPYPGQVNTRFLPSPDRRFVIGVAEKHYLRRRFSFSAAMETNVTTTVFLLDNVQPNSERIGGGSNPERVLIEASCPVSTFAVQWTGAQTLRISGEKCPTAPKGIVVSYGE